MDLWTSVGALGGTVAWGAGISKVQEKKTLSRLCTLVPRSWWHCHLPTLGGLAQPASPLSHLCCRWPAD